MIHVRKERNLNFKELADLANNAHCMIQEEDYDKALELIEIVRDQLEMKNKRVKFYERIHQQRNP